MENTYVEVIDALCDKLGIATSEAAKLIPEVINRGIWSSTGIVAISITLILICSICIILAGKSIMRLSREDKYFGWYDCSGGIEFAAITLGVCVIIAAAILFIVNIYSLVCWLSAPNVSALSWVLAQFK